MKYTQQYYFIVTVRTHIVWYSKQCCTALTGVQSNIVLQFVSHVVLYD